MSDDSKSRVLFGPNYSRLQRLKARYDPESVFSKWYPITPNVDAWLSPSGLREDSYANVINKIVLLVSLVCREKEIIWRYYSFVAWHSSKVSRHRVTWLRINPSTNWIQKTLYGFWSMIVYGNERLTVSGWKEMVTHAVTVPKNFHDHVHKYSSFGSWFFAVARCDMTYTN